MSAQTLLDLPEELLMTILSHVTTPSFIQLTSSCKKLFYLASNSRHAVLQHLHALPGIKLGLDDATVPTKDLFLLLRQRASKHLYGANFTSDCVDLRYRNSSINADASCMAEPGTDYITISTVLKDSLVVRLYGSKCALKERIESPYCGGIGRILKVVHRKHTVSVLYEWRRSREPVPEFDQPLAPKTISERMSPSKITDTSTEDSTEPKSNTQDVKYHLLHYNAYTMDRPYCFSIAPHEDLVPIDLAVNTILQCAIVWDTKCHQKGSSDLTAVLLYTAEKCPLNEEGIYEARVLWPSTADIRPPPPTEAEIALRKAPSKPKRIAFFKDGHRLKFYDAGGTIPYKVVTSGPNYDSRTGSNQVAFENGTLFRVDTPFYGTHDTYVDVVEEQTYCTLAHLCLATANVKTPTSKCKILCILRSKSRFEHDDCGHSVNLTRMAHVSAQNCKVVARLWGWEELSSSQTGLETVSISTFGTRIAISMWNKIYVWALDPKMLCEDIDDTDSDVGDFKNSKTKKSKKFKLKGVADDFYPRTKDSVLGWRVAELKPIILDLDGAIARKMTWSVVDMESEESDSDDPTSTEGSDNPNSEQRANNPSSTLSSEDVVVVLPVTVKEPQIESDTISTQPPGAEVDHENTSLAAVEVPDQTSAATSSNPEDDQLKLSIQISANESGSTLQKMLMERESSASATQRTAQPVIREKQPEIDTDPPPLSQVFEVDLPQSAAAIGPSTSSVDSTPKEPKGKQREVDLDETSEQTTVVAASPASGHAKKIKRHRKRHTEDELIILTDRGIQVWDLGSWGKGKHTREWLAEK